MDDFPSYKPPFIRDLLEFASYKPPFIRDLYHLYVYPLVMINIAMVFRWPIEIDGLPFLKMGGSFHGYVK